MPPLILKNKRLLLAVTGGIAAYKAAELVSKLVAEDASVTVLMSESSTRFISPLTFESLTGNKVYSDLFSQPMSHIHLPEEADLFVIAPATANIIGKLASGIADNIITLSFFAFKGQALFAPAMNWKMYEHLIISRNIRTLKEMGLYEVPPEKGRLACGRYGIGRLAPIDYIVEAIKTCLSSNDLKGKKVIVTAGPTREYIDPIRFISNRSTGKMGYALARAAVRRGAEVILISGPSNLTPHWQVNFIKVENSEEMLNAVKKNIKGIDLLVMAAAVADFVPEDYSAVKNAKESLFSLKLKLAPDIVQVVSQMEDHPFIIGFSAETGMNIERSRRKLYDKGMDFIVFNDVSLEESGFESDTNKISIIDENDYTDYPLMTKGECADVILDHYLEVIGGGDVGH